MHEKRRCAGCGRAFVPRPQVPTQRYCAAKGCQRERRRRWQATKRREDPDYQANQAAAQRRWLARHRGYWRGYRATHPESTERNRCAQRERNEKRRAKAAHGVAAPIAKSDASGAISPLSSGTYRLMALASPGIAKSDAWTVRISLLSDDYGAKGSDCKERT